MRIALLLTALTFAVPLHAQSVTLGGEVTFNPLTVGEIETSNIYNLDQAFAENHGVDVPAPLRVLVPQHDGLHVQAIAVPDGGALMAFVFSQAGDTPQERFFLEDLQVTDAVIPLFADSEDPIHQRRLVAARLLEEEVFPQLTEDYERAEILAIETVELGNAQAALQLIGGYYDQNFEENTMLRVVILPHPNQEESYMAVASINLDRVPVTNAETLAASVSGRVLSSWLYE